MFEKEIEFIYNYNLNKIKHLGSFITYEQLISTNIHPALLQYVSAEIDFLIYEDRQKLLSESLFDYSGEKIVEHFASIAEEIKRAKKFSLEYLTKLLLHASSFNVNYIIRPKWSLLQFVFENKNETSKQVVEVKQILNYLYYYPYLKRLLISFFNKKRILAITLSELEELLNKIDKINFESNFDRVFDSALKSMVEFVNMGEARNNKISKQSIELFLEDKGLAQYKMILTEKFGVSGSDKHEINDYKNVILNYTIEDDTLTSSENELVAQKVEELQNGVDEYEKELNGEDEVSTEIANDDDGNNYNDNLEEKDFDDEQSEKKSFLESHIDGLEEDALPNSDELQKGKNELLKSDLDEIEPPDFDEAPRVDDEIIDEAYELITEEEELDATIDVDTELERVEINEDDGDPFDVADVDESKLDEEMEDTSAITNEEVGNGFIELGKSVTFSSNELIKNDDTNSSNDDVDLDKLSMDSDAEDALEEVEEDNSSVAENEVAEDLVIEEKNNIDALNEEKLDVSDTNPQQGLFDNDDFEDAKEKVEEIDDSINENYSDEITEVAPFPSIDISILLENKKITKIIEVVFDYDMEEFANAIDKISECNNEVEALATIDEISKSLFIDNSTKEIKVLKNIIADFFK